MTNSSIARYLTHFRHYYPGILEWYSRAEAEIASGRRSVFVLWNGSDVEGLAITKNDRRAKLCHISVSAKARGHGFGQSLMQLAVRDMVDRGAREIRVTTDEQVFGNHASFFLAAGFKVIDWEVNRYRRGTSELLWKLDVDPDLWGLRGLRQTWNDLDTLTLAQLGQLEYRYFRGENANREHQHWHALLDLPGFGGTLQENTAHMLYGLRANELEVSAYDSILREMFRRYEHPASLLKRESVSEKRHLWNAVDERLFAKVRRWKRNLTVRISGTCPLASPQKSR